ncbi:MAG: hypothetical protein K9I34_00550 [Bacteroidales bacterium]|nr:hypothetical protein [Bacteroidales bacterium]
MESAKKIVSYLLISIVLLATLISVLSVWEIIQIEDVMFKIVKTLVILFGSTLVILFIFNFFIRQNNRNNAEF